LGLGYSNDPLNSTELPFTYELHEDFKIVPTYSSVFHKGQLGSVTEYNVPGLPKFNPMILLHGEQRLEIIRPLKHDVKYVTKSTIYDV